MVPISTQLSVSAKSPSVVMLVTWSGTVPAFIRVTVAGTFCEVTVLVVYSVTFPNASFCGVKATPARLLWETMEMKALASPTVFPGWP
jgi:hypothetical protein